MKKIMVVLSVVFLLLAGYDQNASIAFATNSGQVTALQPLQHDWGDINIRGGNVSHIFTLSNSGAKDLLLKGAFTSCRCTTAIIEFPDGRRSHQFGMRNNPTNWARAVKPGESFIVNVEFDPMAHGPEDLGPVRRSVYLVSSAPVDGKTSFYLRNIPNGSVTRMTLAGLVLSQEEYQQKRQKQYTVKVGNFDFTEKEYDFGVVKQSQGIVSHEFPFQYNGVKPIRVTGLPTSCACARASIDRAELKAGDQGVIRVEFDPNYHEEPEGKFFRTIFLATEPEVKEEVELKIWVEIDLDLGPDAYKLKAHTH